MIELRGKYNSCKVFTDLIETSAISQMKTKMKFTSMLGKQTMTQKKGQ